MTWILAGIGIYIGICLAPLVIIAGMWLAVFVVPTGIVALLWMWSPIAAIAAAIGALAVAAAHDRTGWRREPSREFGDIENLVPLGDFPD